jgi:TRAP-type C4-dicarboxylate transport system permease large subunit
LEFLLLLFMLASFIILSVWRKMPVGLAMIVSSILMALADGRLGFDLLKLLVKGAFAYLDVSLVLISAMIFMKVIEKNGLLARLIRDIILVFGRSPVALFAAVTVIIMFPGAITGSCVASVLSAGPLLAPLFLQMGMPLYHAAAIITMASVYGMIAPPVNVPVMIIGGGMDVPYVGFDLALLLLILPLAVLTTIGLTWRYLKADGIASVTGKILDKEAEGGIVYLSLLAVIVLMTGPKLVPWLIPDLGLPLIFTAGVFLAFFTGKKTSLLLAAEQGVSDIMPVVGILTGVGMMIEMMTLTGVRGAIVIAVLSLPPQLSLLGMALSLPLFGGISVYGSASVFGVPFALSMLGQNHIITISALSLIAGMGSFLPPVALTAAVAAQVLGEPDQLKVVKQCLLPGLVAVVTGLLVIVFAEPIANIIL